MKYQEMTVNDSFKTGDIWVDGFTNGGDDIILSCKTFGIRCMGGRIKFNKQNWYDGKELRGYAIGGDSICRKVEREKNES